MTRDTHRVTCKAILFNHDRSKVLLANYDGGDWFGLPGGHLDEGEHPDDAVRRELNEELGLGGVSVNRDSFDVHENGKVILYYCGELDESTSLNINNDEMKAANWIKIKDIASHEVTAGAAYDDAILRNVRRAVL